MPFRHPHRNFFEDLGLVEVLEEVRRLPKERTYLKKKHYLRKNLDFKISKTKPITKEPSLVRVKGLAFQWRFMTSES